MRHATLLAVLVGCAADEPPGDLPRASSSSSDEGGQTGQSGTGSEPCEYLYPTVEAYAFDEVAPLGFSAAEAMAAMTPASGEITWSDGVTGAIHAMVAPYDDPAPAVSYRVVDRGELDCVPALTLRAAVELVTDDGRVDRTFVSNELVLWDLGLARVGGSGQSADGWVDLDFLDAEPSGVDLAWTIDVAGDATTGAFRYFDRTAPDGGDWLDIGWW